MSLKVIGSRSITVQQIARDFLLVVHMRRVHVPTVSCIVTEI